MLEKQRECDQKEDDKKKLNEIISQKDAELEEIRHQLLKLKSELIEKNDQIAQMFETLEKKGDEAAELSSRLIELKNQLLDQALFEDKFLATRVPLNELPLSPVL